MKECVVASHKIFTHFVEVLKILLIFEVIDKKIYINYKLYSKTSIFYCMYFLYYIILRNIMVDENHVSLKLAIFTTLCNKC
jgi:hypothetical protein